MRAALGASRGALRRTLLAESLVLCGTGALLGVLLARPLVSRRQPLRRPLLGARARRDGGPEPAVDGRRPRDGRGGGARLRAAPALAVAPTGLAAAVARPAHHARHGRPPPRLRRRPGGASFVLLAGAGMLLRALVALQTASTGYDMRQVLALDVPLPIEAFGPKALDFYERGDRGASRRCRASSAWPSATSSPGATPASSAPDRRSRSTATSQVAGEEDPHAGCASSRRASSRRSASRSSPAATSPTDDRAGRELVVDREPEPGAADVPERRGARPPLVVDRSLLRQARRRAASSASSRTWTTRASCRGRRSRSITRSGSCRTPGASSSTPSSDPYALVPPVTRIIRSLSADQPVERAATLADVRAQVLAPDRLNAFVLSGFAARRAADRGRGRRGCARVLGQRAHARVRRAARVSAGAPRQLLARRVWARAR